MGGAMFTHESRNSPSGTFGEPNTKSGEIAWLSCLTTKRRHGNEWIFNLAALRS